MGTLTNSTADTPHVGQIVEAMRADLANWAPGLGGVAGIAQDPLAVLELLAAGAPKGWRCHSPVWGLWEVARTAEPVPPTGLGRLLGIGAATTLGPGGLAVVDVADGVPASGATATIRGRLGRWKAWAASRRSSSPTTFTPLSRLPDLIAGAGQVPVGGSILRAA
jgi:hypothetical protein